MKLLVMIFEADKEELVFKVLEEQGIQGFTLWSPVHGKGAHSHPRMGSQVWPGDNTMLLTAVTDPTATAFKELLLNHPDMKKGIKVFELDTTVWL